MKFLLIIFTIILCSCNDPKQAPVSLEVAKAPSVTADELLKAMGGAIFKVKLPEDLTKDDMVGCGLKYPDGKIKQSGSNTGYEANEIITVVYIDPLEAKPYWSIVSKSGSLRSPITVEFKMSSPSMKGLHSPGMTLVRFSNGSQITSSEGLPEGDNFDLIVHVSKKQRAMKQEAK